MSENGFVKLPREIVKREWFGDNATLTVYVFLLCSAVFSDIEYAGRTLRKGQYITSNRQLSEKCQLGIQQVKTALKHLKATHDITVEPSTKFSIITVNFAAYPNSADPLSNPQVNPRVNPQTNPISRSNEKEENKEEYNREEAAPPFTPDTNNDISVEALTKQYGSEAVGRYEEKFRKWAQSKNTSKISMYATIAKWMAQDIGQSMKKKSSIDYAEFERRILEQYRKNSG